MKKRICLFVTVLVALVFFLAGTYKIAKSEGKAWSKQYFSSDKNISIIGSENKYGKVYGIDLPQKKILWSVNVPQSQKISLKFADNVVYLIGSKDMGFGSSIMAQNLKNKGLIWKRRIDDYSRITPVYQDDNNLFFAAYIPFRGINKIVLYGLNKANGKDTWKPITIGFGTLKEMIKSADGNFILIFDTAVTQTKPTIKVVKVNSKDGKFLWNFSSTPQKSSNLLKSSTLDIDGTIASKPQEIKDCIYFLGSQAVESSKKYKLYAIEKKTGQIQMQKELPEGFIPFGEPVFIDKAVIVLSTSGKLNAYNISNDTLLDIGNLLWETNLEESPIFPPVLSKENDKIYITTNKILDGEFQSSNINAISTLNGSKIWNFENTDMIEPPIALTKEALLSVAKVKNDDKDKKELKVFALDPNTGNKMWSIKEEGIQENKMLVKDDLLYLFLMSKGEKDAKGKVLPSRSFIALNIKDGQLKWEYRTPTVINTQLYFIGDSIIFGTKDGYIIAINKNNGTKDFKFFAGKENELDSNISVYKDNSGKVALMGFATQKGKYFIIDSKGKLQKEWNLKPLFASYKMPIFVGALILGGAISWYIYHARKGKEMFIRRIAGLNAIEEAVGRSTEMGKPVVYVTGLADVDDIQTLASLSIMGHIAQKTAEYDTPIIVPCCRSVVMSTAQEVVKESYLKAGRPDTYRRENIYYLTDDQFGYVAGVDGIMVREKPAANFYLGKFYAESLILAETGHSTGAIQIAGTAEAAQLPFFVAACDYTLIGEELFAASAYLSKDPMQIGSLKGQDMAKAIILIAILAGCLLLTNNLDWVKLLFATQ